MCISSKPTVYGHWLLAAGPYKGYTISPTHWLYARQFVVRISSSPRRFFTARHQLLEQLCNAANVDFQRLVRSNSYRTKIVTHKLLTTAKAADNRSPNPLSIRPIFLLHTVTHN